MTQPTEDRTAINVDQFFPHPPERVWKVLTTSELMARWLMPNDFVPEVGHAFTFQGRPVPASKFSGTGRSEVLAVDPPKLLRITWRDADPSNPLDTVVTWRLEPEGSGTRMFLDHTGFRPDEEIDQITRKIMSGGWRSTVLSGFTAVLDEIAG